MNFDLDLLKNLGVIASSLLAPVGGWLALRRRAVQHRAHQEKEMDQVLAQAATQFAGHPGARDLFEKLQLQRVIRRVTGVAPAPVEFEAFIRFYLQRQASLNDVKSAWRHRCYTEEGDLTFQLSVWDRIVLTSGRVYTALCILAGGLIGLSIFLEPASLPLSQLLLRSALGVAMMLCAILPFYANGSEEAALRLRHRQDGPVPRPSVPSALSGTPVMAALPAATLPSGNTRQGSSGMDESTSSDVVRAGD